MNRRKAALKLSSMTLMMMILLVVVLSSGNSNAFQFRTSSHDRSLPHTSFSSNESTRPKIVSFKRKRSVTSLKMSSRNDDWNNNLHVVQEKRSFHQLDETSTNDAQVPPPGVDNESNKQEATNLLSQFLKFRSSLAERYKKMPPIQVEDMNVLLYDIFLIVNLTASISFWVTHRMDLNYLSMALSEGCLFSCFWIIAGLYHGSFLWSSVDGHFGSSDERGGPKAAAMLAANTFVNATSLRLLFALIVAIFQHRPVGASPSEELLPLEIGFGLVLMASWRALHSSFVPRI